eukprot:3936673-Rhodomonas_salina.3
MALWHAGLSRRQHVVGGFDDHRDAAMLAHRYHGRSDRGVGQAPTPYLVCARVSSYAVFGTGMGHSARGIAGCLPLDTHSSGPTRGYGATQTVTTRGYAATRSSVRIRSYDATRSTVLMRGMAL